LVAKSSSSRIASSPIRPRCKTLVDEQHRGRIFLPFADDDPKTAEVVSKVLLLARDKQIKDPTILEQILPKNQQGELAQ
jgi:hypothetical protein